MIYNYIINKTYTSSLIFFDTLPEQVTFEPFLRIHMF